MTWYWPDFYDHVREEPLCGACNDRGRVGRRRCRSCDPDWLGRLQNRVERYWWALRHPRRSLALRFGRRAPWGPF